MNLNKTGTHLFQGNEAVVEAAILSGCRFFAGYPITPSTEIAELMAVELPKVGGRFIQMEDEIGSMGAVIGASLTGTKAMTATSGPGFSLKQENIGYASFTETPVVVVNVQRVGPSTGMPTAPSQGDVMQARWGTHGDHPVVAIAPGSVAEAYTATIRAFSISEFLRVPVILLLDEVIGHMREGVSVEDVQAVEHLERKRPKGSKSDFRPYRDDGSGVPPMANFGDGYRFHVTGLFHDERGYPDLSPEWARTLMKRLMGKLDAHRDVHEWVEETETDDAEILIVSYGSPAQAATSALRQARAEGLRVGQFRVVTVWPFPEDALAKYKGQVRAVLVPEMNLGQLRLEVERVMGDAAPVLGLHRADGELFKPAEILEKIREVD